MELLYLLLSIISTFLTSLFYSLLRVFVPRGGAQDRHTNSVSFYQGIVWHERRRPVHHSFRYPVRYALFDLDNSSHLPPDHLSADEARHAANTTGSVFLLTVPPSVGYEQNPLSLYYCYDGDGSHPNLTKCVAEVTNTPWGERVAFVFNPSSDCVAKPLHVSPFMVCLSSFFDTLIYEDMMGNWKIRASAPGDNLSVVISVQHPDHGDYFVATLDAKKTTVTDSDSFFWLMPHKVAVWIYWHALQLWWKNVKFIQHPRYSTPNYREEAVIRNETLQCRESVSRGRVGGCLQSQGCNPKGRWLKWRDAKWPWC
ncbi:hypothetical protein LINPERPRIM_LOCUS7026 [Linum perenne]